MNLEANIIGATGLVGKQLVKLLLENEHFEKVRIFVRRDSGIKHKKLEQQIVDYSDDKTWSTFLQGDVLFSALGTTLKQAGSKEKQYEIDFEYNLNFAKAAKKNGIGNYVLVSSIGADANSKMFYTWMKGELDEAVANLDFENLAILRPASLTGNRKNKRLGEIITIPLATFVTQFILKKYRPISDITVAKAMICLALNPVTEKTIFENTELFALANEISFNQTLN